MVQAEVSFLETPENMKKVHTQERKHSEFIRTSCIINLFKSLNIYRSYIKIFFALEVVDCKYCV